jgi:Tfp pilus assembly protein PilN
MTTAVAPGPAAPVPEVQVDPWRLITIGANLLPVEITESRRIRRVRWVVIVSFILFLALLAAWYLRATMQTDDAEDRVGQAQDRVQVLQRKEHEFSEVTNVQQDAKLITSQLSTLFAPDLQWAKLMADVRAAAPTGITLTALVGNINLGSTTPDAGAGQLPSTTTDKTVGAITITGTGKDKATVAAYVDAVTKVSGLANPQISDVTLDEQNYRFTVRLDITAARLSGRFTPASPAPSASSGTGN